MPGLSIMLPVALVIALVFLAFFIWSANNGDYEDGEMPKYRMIHDDGDEADREMQASGAEDQTGPALVRGKSSPELDS